MNQSSVRHLTLESCNKFGYESLAKVRGLTRLELLGCRGLTEFSWLRDCKKLRRLVVTATPASRMDFSELKHSRVAELFFGVQNKTIAEVSKMCPSATVSNGDVWYRKGNRGAGDDPLSTSD